MKEREEPVQPCVAATMRGRKVTVAGRREERGEQQEVRFRGGQCRRGHGVNIICDLVFTLSKMRTY